MQTGFYLTADAKVVFIYSHGLEIIPSEDGKSPGISGMACRYIVVSTGELGVCDDEYLRNNPIVPIGDEAAKAIAETMRTFMRNQVADYNKRIREVERILGALVTHEDEVGQ